MDVVLNELYVPYDLPNKDTYKELKVAISPYNMFNDPAFQPKGLDSLSGLLKLMVSRRKLHLCWIEGGI